MSGVGAAGAAAIAAGGAIVGGVLTGGSNLVIERARQKKAEVADAKVRSIELRRARRLVEAELKLDLSGLEAAVQNPDSFKLHPSELLPVREWETHGATLASHLDDETWHACARAYSGFGLLRKLDPGEHPYGDAEFMDGFILPARTALGLLLDHPS